MIGVSGAIAIKGKRTKVEQKVAGQKILVHRIKKSHPSRSLPETHGSKVPHGKSPWDETEIDLGDEDEELPNGKGAWNNANETNKKLSRRRGGKNKVGDASLAVKAENTPTNPNAPNGVVNILLYVGFALVALGMILTFVGMGERGFKTVELKLIGPSLIGCGILFTILRVMFCSFTCTKKPKPLEEKSLLSPSQETLAEDRESTPPIPITKVIRKPNRQPLAPIVRHVQPKDSPALENSPAIQNHLSMPNLIEDEVESDTDLGLDVQYADDKPKTSSRGATAKSARSQPENEPSPGELTSRQDIPTLNSSFDKGEVLLDPSKLSEEIA